MENDSSLTKVSILVVVEDRGGLDDNHATYHDRMFQSLLLWRIGAGHRTRRRRAHHVHVSILLVVEDRGGRGESEVHGESLCGFNPCCCGG